MDLKIDSDDFCKKQEVFIGETIAVIADRLEEVGISGYQLKELTSKIAFDVACIIDDTAGLEFDGVKANPYLTFLSENEDLIHLGGNSFTHELVQGIVDAMFEENT